MSFFMQKKLLQSSVLSAMSMLNTRKNCDGGEIKRQPVFFTSAHFIEDL